MATSSLDPGVRCGLYRHSNGTFFTFKEGPTTGQLWIASSTDGGITWVNDFSYGSGVFTSGACILEGDILYFNVEHPDPTLKSTLGRYNVITKTLLQSIAVDKQQDPIISGMLITPTHIFCDMVVNYRTMGTDYTRPGFSVATIGGAWGTPIAYEEITSNQTGFEGVFDGTDTFYKNTTSGNKYKVIISTGVVTNGITFSGFRPQTMASHHNIGSDYYTCSIRALYKHVISGNNVAGTREYTHPNSYPFGTNAKGSKCFYDSTNSIWHFLSCYTDSSANRGALTHWAHNGSSFSSYSTTSRSQPLIDSSDDIVYGAYIDESSATLSAIDVYGNTGWRPGLGQEASIQLSLSASFSFASTIDITSDLTLQSLQILSDISIPENSIDISSSLTFPKLLFLSNLEAFRLNRNISSAILLPALTITSDLVKHSIQKIDLLQVSHKLNGYLINIEDVRYRLVLEDDSIISVMDFSIKKVIDIRDMLLTSARLSLPKILQTQLIELIGTNLSLYKYIGLDSQLIATGEMISSEVDNTDRVTLILELLTDEIGNALFSENNAEYIRSTNGRRSLRFPPNHTITVGDSVIYNDYTRIIARSVSTYVSNNQSFTEVTE